MGLDVDAVVSADAGIVGGHTKDLTIGELDYQLTDNQGAVIREKVRQALAAGPKILSISCSIFVSLVFLAMASSFTRS